MKQNSIVMLIVLLGILAILSFACNGNGGELSKKEIDAMAAKLKMPIYSNTQEVKFYNLNEVIDGVSYKLKLPYEPSMSSDVLKFYDSKMQERGFKPFVEDYYKYADRVWQESIDGTKKGEPFVAQLIADWVDDKQTVRARLVMRYYWYDYKAKSFVPGDNNDLHVEFQYMPFVVLPPPAKVK